MSDSPLPKSWKEAGPYLIWGVLIFTSGFEGIAFLIDGEWKKSFLSFALMFILTALALHWRQWIGKFWPHFLHENIAASPLEIIFDPANPSRKFWSIEPIIDSQGKTIGSHWEYRAAIKNKLNKTIRNVAVLVEATGPMPTRPEQSLFDLNKGKVIDLHPGQEALVIVRRWWNPPIVQGMAAGEDIYGPIKVIVSADDTPSSTKLFHFDPMQTPMIYEFDGSNEAIPAPIILEKVPRGFKQMAETVYPPKPNFTATLEKASLEREREFVESTPAYLMKFFDGHTDLQAQSLIAPYIGKWMKISAALHEISKHADGVMVTFKLKGELSFVFLYFSAQWLERLAVIQRGAKITVMGKITNVDAIKVRLTDCELA